MIKAPFISLPVEVATIIFGKLNGTSLMLVRLVSRVFCEIVETDKNLKKKILAEYHHRIRKSLGKECLQVFFTLDKIEIKIGSLEKAIDDYRERDKESNGIELIKEAVIFLCKEGQISEATCLIEREIRLITTTSVEEEPPRKKIKTADPKSRNSKDLLLKKLFLLFNYIISSQIKEGTFTVDTLREVDPASRKEIWQRVIEKADPKEGEALSLLLSRHSPELLPYCFTKSKMSEIDIRVELKKMTLDDGSSTYAICMTRGRSIQETNMNFFDEEALSLLIAQVLIDKIKKGEIDSVTNLFEDCIIYNALRALEKDSINKELAVFYSKINEVKSLRYLKSIKNLSLKADILLVHFKKINLDALERISKEILGEDEIEVLAHLLEASDDAAYKEILKKIDHAFSDIELSTTTDAAQDTPSDSSSEENAGEREVKKRKITKRVYISKFTIGQIIFQKQVNMGKIDDAIITSNKFNLNSKIIIRLLAKRQEFEKAYELAKKSKDPDVDLLELSYHALQLEDRRRYASEIKGASRTYAFLDIAYTRIKEEGDLFAADAELKVLEPEVRALTHSKLLDFYVDVYLRNTWWRKRQRLFAYLQTERTRATQAAVSARKV